jgi:transcriptional regulator with XRE-family HTH domain
MVITFDRAKFYDEVDMVRFRSKMDWKQVSEETGVSRATLSRLKSGRGPCVDTAAALAVWANIRLEDMFKQEEV